MSSDTPHNTTSWAALADWYDERMGEEGDTWHRLFLDPVLFAHLGPVAGLRVLDLACGNGHNARRLARMGAQVIGVDASPGVVAHACAREAAEPLGIAYHTADASVLSTIANTSLDLVICQMALMDMPNAQRALAEVGRVLAPGGRFVALILHPCFFIPEASGWVIERMGPDTTVWRKVRRYLEPFAGHIYFRQQEQIVYTTHYHRPLSWYVRALGEAGLTFVALEEPKPSEEFVSAVAQGEWMRDIPQHCLIDARKPRE